MLIFDKSDSNREEIHPGVERWELVTGERGAESLSVLDLSLAQGSEVPNHIHPTEEAMVILEGELEFTMGDQVAVATAGQTVLAPAGVKHGCVNRSGSPARLIAIFPTVAVERTSVE